MSKVVFVGNVPYNMGEDQLIDVFKSVGQVIGFRLVFDRDTGKPRGYGFCEFADHETAMSAVRNLNNADVGGRPLRIDLADSDPFLEGKTTVRGELIDGGTPGPSEPRSQWRTGGPGDSRSHGSDAFLASLPPGIQVPKGASALDYISSTLANMQPSQLMEVLAQMKAFVITHPEQARSLLVAHPQLAYALFQALLLNKVVDSAILQRMLAATSGGAQQPAPPPPRPPMPPPHLQQPPPYPPHPHPGYPMQPPQLQQPQPHPGLAPPPMSAPPASAMFPHHQQHQPMVHHPPPQGMPPMPPYYRPPPPPAVSVPTPQPQVQPPPQAQPPVQPQGQAHPATAEISDSQRSMLLQVFSMTSEQINAFSETERTAILQLRNQFMGNLGNLGV
ncbi:Cleavage stimulation factor subunit 2 [Hypsizygus marmoreus]|uniref:Cleavage stimulation factor subunit 2 n=1 Tax=Hypsizygus marmoreus TaxID=39966 RepID=A0A369JPR9_HYPMA|nr:Cleavage stimulation factor subunit 2 [Hypsizygus marmoreus]